MATTEQAELFLDSVRELVDQGQYREAAAHIQSAQARAVLSLDQLALGLAEVFVSQGYYGRAVGVLEERHTGNVPDDAAPLRQQVLLLCLKAQSSKNFEGLCWVSERATCLFDDVASLVDRGCWNEDAVWRSLRFSYSPVAASLSRLLWLR